MSADVKIKTIEQIYQAFGRGDVAAILNAVTDDIDWATETSSTAAPWYGVRHGKDGVAAFFTAFGSAMEIEESPRPPWRPTTLTCSRWSGAGPGPQHR